MLSSFDNSTFALSLLLFGRLISCDHQAGLRFGKILSHRAFFLPQLTNLFNFLFVDEFALDISLRRRTGVELLSLAWTSYFLRYNRHRGAVLLWTTPRNQPETAILPRITSVWSSSTITEPKTLKGRYSVCPSPTRQPMDNVPWQWLHLFVLQLHV